MKSASVKYFIIIFGFLILHLVNPASTIGQVDESRFINGDALPDAPELALRGDYKIGVRTIEIVHKNKIDILNGNGGAEPVYDRKLKLEVWYPTIIPLGETDLISYDESRGTPNEAKKPFIQCSFSGRALRDGEPIKSEGPFPLIIVSHGYIGSRLLMTYLTENLASKGYVVVSIDHMESTYQDAEGLKGLKVPVFFIAGNQDDVSGYEKGTKAIYNGAVNSDRYLLTYVNARHNVAPNPPPKEALKPGFPFDFYYHYAEPAWDQRRLNNINQHFVSAFMGIQLKKKEYSKYLDFDPTIKNWPGFKPRTSVGLELVHSAALKPE